MSETVNKPRDPDSPSSSATLPGLLVALAFIELSGLALLTFLALQNDAELPLLAIVLALVSLPTFVIALRMRKLLHERNELARHLHGTTISLEAEKARAMQLAHRDGPTGLPNRTLFCQLADAALANAASGAPVAILLLDVDKFRRINDRWGHAAADTLIAEIARRMTHILPTPDSIARLGGDDFAVLLQKEDLKHGLAEITEHIFAEIRRPFDLLGTPVQLTASIGAVMAPDCGTERAALLRKADAALYRAKREGGNRCQIFVPSMDETNELRTALEADLRVAIATGSGLGVHFQPVVDSSQHVVVGLEAFARWHHPTRGWVPPPLFIPVAEDTGLAVPLGEWVLSEACKVASEWPELAVAVNVSAAQLRDPNLVSSFTRIVRAAGVSPSQIELDVGESVLFAESSRSALARLRAEGFRIALDDFGCGRPVLKELRGRELDKIKIDGSYIHGLGFAADASAAVSSVLRLGRSMGVEVSAECVETREQEQFLREAGCERLQGFLFSRAVPAHHLRMALAGYRDEKAA
ncbi:MAG TPA: EAL domain-containing protein [Croceibacterium sp.]|nr:EAL domain-containing protein [Croceibacterium sp.]